MDTEDGVDVEYYASENRKGLPFSTAVRVGRMLYLSGQIGIDGSGKLAPGGIVAETRWSITARRLITSLRQPSCLRT